MSPLWLNRENRYKSFNETKLAGNDEIDRRFMFMKIFRPKGFVCLCPGAIHMYMTYFQTCSSLNALGQSKQNII